MEEFKDELSIFAESFNMHGPGAAGDNLEKGTRAKSPLYTGCETNATTKKFLGFRVHLFLQSSDRKGEFHLLIQEWKLYHGWWVGLRSFISHC